MAVVAPDSGRVRVAERLDPTASAAAPLAFHPQGPRDPLKPNQVVANRGRR